MKTYFIAAALSLLVLSTQAQKGYVVEGNITGMTDGTIEMKKVYDGKVLNEAEVKGGKFTFKQDGKFVGDKVMIAGAGVRRFEFYIEPGKIIITGDVKGPITVSGTPSNDALTKYLNDVAPIEKKIADLRRQILAQKDTVEKKKLERDLGYQYESVFYPMRKNFAKTHNNTILAAEFLSAGTGELQYKDMKALLGGLDPKTPENWYTNRLKNRLKILEKTDIGKTLPDFTLPDTSGNMVKFSSLRGKIVLVDFWASWCKPCREENQNVKKLYEQYGKAGFTVISVSIDEHRDKWTLAIRQDKLPWYHVSSLTGWSCPVANDLGVAYGMSGVPYTLLVGRDGKVIDHNVRGQDLEVKLAELFKNN